MGIRDKNVSDVVTLWGPEQYVSMDTTTGTHSIAIHWVSFVNIYIYMYVIVKDCCTTWPKQTDYDFYVVGPYSATR